jgi:hypothetical protein
MEKSLNVCIRLTERDYFVEIPEYTKKAKNEKVVLKKGGLGPLTEGERKWCCNPRANEVGGNHMRKKALGESYLEWKGFVLVDFAISRKS